MIIVKLKGGLGNQMFQYALGRVLALKNNTELGLDLNYLLDRTPRMNFTFRDFSLDVFNIKAKILPVRPPRSIILGTIGIYLEAFQRKFLKTAGIEKGFGFDSSILNLKDGAYLNGSFQSPKYFNGYENVIKGDFIFRNLSEKTKILGAKIHSENSLCIHIRRGDYVNNRSYEVVGLDYYKKGIEVIKEKVDKIEKIYVFSEDVKWCEKNMKFEIPTVFVREEYFGEKSEGHLYLMNQCKYFIIPNSSFSWWGAWLSEREGKIVVCPSRWFADKLVNIDDIIPEGWLKI